MQNFGFKRGEPISQVWGWEKGGNQNFSKSLGGTKVLHTVLSPPLKRYCIGIQFFNFKDFHTCYMNTRFLIKIYSIRIMRLRKSQKLRIS